MRSIRGALTSLAVGSALAYLGSGEALAQPTINNPTVVCSRNANGVVSGTENSTFIFYANVTPGTAPLLSVRAHIDVADPATPENPPVAATVINLQPAAIGANWFIGFAKGSTLNAAVGGQTTGTGVPVSHTWSIVARDVSAGGTPPGFQSSPKPAGTFIVYPSRFDTSSGLPVPAISIVPVDAAGSNDKAPGVGQQGNGLRVDPQDPTSPNDGGSSHFFTWRCRVTTLSGMPVNVFRGFNAWEWNRNQRSPVTLVLTDPQGFSRFSPMEVDPKLNPGYVDPFVTDPNLGIQFPLGSGTWSGTGVVYRYQMLPTQYTPTQFGGDFGSPPAFTIPDGTGALFLGGGGSTSEIGHPISEEYVGFAGLDTRLISPFPPPEFPYYTRVANRAGQWSYYYMSTIDIWPTFGNGANFNLLTLPTPNGILVSDQSGATTAAYNTLIDSDDPNGYPGSSAFPYRHPFVTPLLSDGGWTDDLPENNFLQSYAAYQGAGRNSNRSRVTTATKVRFQVRVTRAPTDVAPILVRVHVAHINGAMQPFTMQPLPIPGNNDYTQGVVYFYDTIFPEGTQGLHGTYFEADDGQHKAIWPRRPPVDQQGAGLPNRGDNVTFGTATVGRNYVMEPWVNNRPRLSNPSVSPTSGVEAQPYTYRVTFTDADNDEPVEMWVIVDNDPVNKMYRMTPDPNQPGGANRPTSQGRQYLFQITQLPTTVGKHSYYFMARDNWAPTNAPIRREYGEYVNLPQGDVDGNPSGVIEGPIIVGNTAPELTEVSYSFSDPALTEATLFDFFVRYRDFDNEAPAFVKLFISNDGGATYDAGTSLIKAEASNNYANGVQYHPAQRISLPPGNNYRFKFIANDGKVDTIRTRVGTGANSIAALSFRNLVEVLPTPPGLQPKQAYADPQGHRILMNASNEIFVWQGAGATPTLLQSGVDFTTNDPNGYVVLNTANAGDLPIRASYYYIETLGPVIVPNSTPVIEPIDPADPPNFKTVTPLSGTTTTSFTFSAIYKDADNQPPVDDSGLEGMYAVVDGGPNQTKIRLTKDPATPIPADYRQGVRYNGSSTLPLGNHNYHFEASDMPLGVNNRPASIQRYPGIGAELPGPVVENIGQLAQTDVDIVPFPKGKSTDAYQFTVTYTNTNDLAPPSNLIELRIKDTAAINTTTVQMVPIDPVQPGSYQAGVRYRATLSAPAAPLNPGTHEIAAGFVNRPAATAVKNLIVNGIPVLSNPMVDPPAPAQSRDIVFSVRYTDINGDPPTQITLTVDGTAIASPAPTTSPANPTATDYMNGVQYIWTMPGSRFTIGAHTFQFSARDDLESATPVPAPAGNFVMAAGGAMALLEPTPGVPATNNGTLTPLAGPRSGTYTFEVKFSHADNIPPNRIQLLIDAGSANQITIDMQPKPGDPLNYVAGVLYSFTSAPNQLNAGAHTYHFEAEDRVVSVRLPAAGEYAGPTVNNAPALSYSGPLGAVTISGNATIFSVDALNQLNPPANASINDQITFRAIYQDRDGTAPGAGGYVRAIVNGTTMAMTPRAGDPLNYANGVVYETTPQVLSAGTKTFHFEAFDGFDTARLPGGVAEVTGLTVKNVLELLEPTPGDPATNNGTLTPITGSQQATVYKYRVKYRHLDGAAPSRIQLFIDEGTPNANVVDLAVVPGQGVDYTVGVLYGHDTIPGDIGPGSHTYRFEASDTLVTLSLPPAGVYQGPTINTAPTLTGGTAFVEGSANIPIVNGQGQLVPPVADHRLKNFVFRARYTDGDNVAPSAGGYVRVVVDGMAIAMAPSAGDPLNWSSGVTFEALVSGGTLGTGQKTFRFEASDGSDTARDPQASDVSGLTVRDLPELEAPGAGTVNPVNGPVSQVYTFRVNYKHNDNTTPAFVRVFIDGTAHDMTKATSGSDFVAGVEYEYKHKFPVGTTERDHNHRFEAVDSLSPDYTAEHPMGGGMLDGPELNIATFGQPTFNPNPGIVGGTVNVLGILDANTQIGSVDLDITLVKPGGTGLNGSTTTTVNGDYNYTTPLLDQTGDWKFRLHWNGILGQYDPVTTEFIFRVTGYTLPLVTDEADLIASPLVPVSPDPAFTLNPVDGAGNPVNLAVLALQRWVGTGGVTGRYLRVGDPGFPALGPGQGFWVRPTSLTTLSPRGSLVDQTKPFSVPLAEGWNMFGSVFIGDINWSAVKVRFQGVEYPIAAAGQIVRSNAWGYDRAARSYRIITSADVVRAGRGYWIRALQACELVLAPPGTRAAPGRDADMKTKSLQIVAKIANRSDLDNFAPLTGLDKTRIAELEKPAYIADYVTVRFLSADAVQLPEGTRAPAGATTLAFEVETDRPNADVSVVFPTVATLGRKNEMTLVDLSTGTRRALGSIAGYSYNSGENVAPRRFAVIVSQRKANTSLLISSVRSTGRSGGALSFSFDLSHGASVRAQIVAGGGRVIRDIAQGRAATEGVNTLLWDGRDARGASVPAGSYLLKLSATDEVGRAASAVLPVTVVR